jgi:hypothetical protein
MKAYSGKMFIESFEKSAHLLVGKLRGGGGGGETW